jgi:Uma2 family endonuclease
MSALAKLSLAEYERIVSTGVFDGRNKRRIELIRGELREMNPIGSYHAEMVDRVGEWSRDNAPRATIRVRVQNPLAFLSVESEPEPDIVWAKRKDYAASHPEADDVLLLIEVADSSLDYDRVEKASIYATVGIREYWIVDLPDCTVKVRREPAGGHYASIRSYASGEIVQPLAVPDARLIVDTLFGPPT